MLFCKILLEYKTILVTLSCSNLKLYSLNDFSINFLKEGRFRHQICPYVMCL